VKTRERSTDGSRGRVKGICTNQSINLELVAQPGQNVEPHCEEETGKSTDSMKGGEKKGGNDMDENRVVASGKRVQANK